MKNAPVRQTDYYDSLILEDLDVIRTIDVAAFKKFSEEVLGLKEYEVSHGPGAGHSLDPQHDDEGVELGAMDKYVQGIILHREVIAEECLNIRKHWDLLSDQVARMKSSIARLCRHVYFGNENAAMAADKCIPLLVWILNRPKLKHGIHMLTIKGLSEVLYSSHRLKKRFAEVKGSKLLIHCIREMPRDPEIACWAAYCLAMGSINCPELIAQAKMDPRFLDLVRTGTFGRVVLVQERTGDYGALKVISLFDAVRLKQVDHVKNEKNILRSISHPFIVNLKWHDKDEYNVYMLFDYVPGGELFSYLRKAGHFSSSTSSFYAAEIVSALEYLHSKSIVFRDLKPENLLLDKEGHLKVTDFGFAKKLSERYNGMTWTLCGTPEYIAPEVIQSKGHNKAVDWWALGVLIFEMHCGYAPFYHDNTLNTYEKILAAKIEWPKFVDPTVKDIVKKLLVVDKAKRLGNLKHGADDVKKHRLFRDYNWDDVYNRRLKPPIIPRVTFDGDTRNFAEYTDQQSWTLKRVSEQQQELFADF